jgi:Ni,Fe-hydrogenase I small subunit
MKKSKLTQEQHNRAVRMMLAFLCVATEAEASLLRKVEILDKFEFSDIEIAKVCGCTTQSVANARALRKRIRKQ